MKFNIHIFHTYYNYINNNIKQNKSIMLITSFIYYHNIGYCGQYNSFNYIVKRLISVKCEGFCQIGRIGALPPAIWRRIGELVRIIFS